VGLLAVLALPATVSAQCTNTCGTAFDNECDDGGPGSLYAICPLGTDCNDCGPRGGGYAPPPTPTPTPTPTPGAGGPGCTNTCGTAFDNECDDGGPGSLYAICPLGTDCNDCGPRGGGYATPTPPQAQPSYPTGGGALPPPAHLVLGPPLLAQFCARHPQPSCNYEIEVRDLNGDLQMELVAHHGEQRDYRILTWNGAGWVDVLTYWGGGVSSNLQYPGGGNLGWPNVTIHSVDFTAGGECHGTNTYVWNGSAYAQTGSFETGACD
jgi:hypothetical protein